MKKVLRKRVVIIIALFIALVVISSTLTQGYAIGELTFNGGSYGLKDKEFTEGTDFWTLSSGTGTTYPYGRIGECLKVSSGSSYTTIYQELEDQEVNYAKGRYLGFVSYLKGTQSGDQFRVSIKYRYYYYQFYYPFYFVKRYRTLTAYGNWEAKSDSSATPWTLASVNKKLPSTTVEVTVQIEIQNTNGYNILTYVDDAELSVYAFSKTDEDFSYYHYIYGRTESANVKDGVSATIFEQETLAGDHTWNQMTLAVNAFGASESMGLHKIVLKIEMLPEKFHEGIPFWPFDDWHYTTQYGDLNILSQTSYDDGFMSQNQAVNDVSFITLKFSFQVLFGAVTSAVTGNPAAGVVASYGAGIASDYLAATLLGRKNDVSNTLDATGQIDDGDGIDSNEGRDYYTKTTWDFKTEYYTPYGKITIVPSVAQTETFMQWTYKKGQEECSILITGTFYWGHYEYTSYGANYVSDGTTTSTLELSV